MLIHMLYGMLSTAMNWMKKIWFFRMDTNWLLRNGNKHLSGTQNINFSETKKSYKKIVCLSLEDCVTHTHPNDHSIHIDANNSYIWSVTVFNSLFNNNNKKNERPKRNEISCEFISVIIRLLFLWLMCWNIYCSRFVMWREHGENRKSQAHFNSILFKIEILFHFICLTCVKFSFTYEVSLRVIERCEGERRRVQVKDRRNRINGMDHAKYSMNSSKFITVWNVYLNKKKLKILDEKKYTIIITVLKTTKSKPNRNKIWNRIRHSKNCMNTCGFFMLIANCCVCVEMSSTR